MTWDGVRYPTRRPRSMAINSPEAATTICKCSWRWTQKASETCRAILQLQINILPSCITLVLLYISYSWLFAGRRICVSDFTGAKIHRPSLRCSFFLTSCFFSQLRSGDRVSYLFCRKKYICSARERNGAERNWSCRLNYAITLTLDFITNIICLLHRFSKNNFDGLFMSRKDLSTNAVNKKLSKLFTCQYLNKMTSIGL